MARVTIREIAQEAGVSIGTVDRVLHNRGRVSKEKTEQILAICKARGYEQNIVGKAMSMQKKQRRVAVVVNGRGQNSFSAQVYQGLRRIEEEIRDYNIVFQYHDLVEHTVQELVGILDRLAGEDLAGLIIKPMDNPMVQLRLQELAAKGVPMVFCTSDIAGVDKLCYVGQNANQDGRLMANMLCKIKREPLRILLLTAPLANTVRRARIDGFLSYLRQHQSGFSINDICEMNYNPEETFAATVNAMKKYPQTNAVCINALDAQTCIKAIKSAGNYKGLCFSFGHKERIAPLLESGNLDFVIAEQPLQHGYKAGEIIFKYLLYGETPKDKTIYFRGEILLEENGSFAELQ